ncbi:MAG TPA: RidA family protein [Acidimicrobiales bacterium]|nr:RidA family protein [Acidimicrobiales bacterium]
MSKRVVTSGSEIGPYSSAVVAGEHCYVAGTGGFLPGTMTLAGGGIEGEIRQTMKNLQANLERAGFALRDVVSVTCYLRSMADWPALNEIYGEHLGEQSPARAAVVVGEMPGGANIEISCIAWRSTSTAGSEA